MFSQNFHYLGKMVDELWKPSFHQTTTEYNQIVFITIKIIYNGMNKSAREFGCCILVNNTFNLHVKVRGSFLSSVQFTYNSTAFVSHWYFWCPMYRDLLFYTWVVILKSILYFGGTSSTHCKVHQFTSNFDMEIKRIVNKYTAARFPSRFVHSIIDNFDSGKDNLIIP